MREAGSGPSWLGRMRARIRARGFVVRAVQLVKLAILFVEGVMAIHVVLRVAGANPAAGFSRFIDTLSAPFIGPFRPVFTDQLVNGHPLEVGSLLGMAVYAILAFVAIRVIRGVFSPGHL